MVKRTYGVPPPPFPPAPSNPFRRAAPTSTPKCMVCTTPTRCGAPALHTKGPRCIGRADGKDDCDCLNACGDDPWIGSGRSMPCEHRRETQARIAALTQAAPTTPSPTAGMNIAQRILHVGGRNNAAGYVEFGSIQAVEALVRQVLRDLPAAPQPSPASQGDALDAACQRACMELPEGMSMAIQLERDAGWIELHGSYGDQIELPNADGSLAEQVHQAIDAARAAQEGK